MLFLDLPMQEDFCLIICWVQFLNRVESSVFCPVLCVNWLQKGIWQCKSENEYVFIFLYYFIILGSTYIMGRPLFLYIFLFYWHFLNGKKPSCKKQ